MRKGPAINAGNLMDLASGIKNRGVSRHYSMSPFLTTITKNRQWVLLVILFLLVSGARFVISWPIAWASVQDEAWYASSANSFFETFQFLIGGQFNSFGLPLYSVFISPAYFFKDMGEVFTAIKFINSFVMSSAMFPVFLLARRFMPFKGALIVSVLSVIIGPMFYTFRIMAESLHYPLAMWIFYLMYTSLIGGKKGTDVILGVAFGFACLNKMSSLAIVVSYVVLIVICSREPGSLGLLKRFPIICFRAILRYWYVLIAFAITVLPYILYRATETESTGVVPYAYRWQVFFRNITDFDLTKYLKWFLMYLGQLNLSSGLFLLPVSSFMVVWLCKSERKEENILGYLSVVVMVCVLSLAVLQSGYNLDRLTERHFFVLTPLVFILAVLWFLGPKKRIGEIWWGIICLTAIIASGSALFLESSTASPAVDSAFFDTLQAAKAWGVSGFEAKAVVLGLSSFLILFTRFAGNRWMVRIAVAVVFLFMVTLTGSVYSQSNRYLQRLKEARKPMVQWLSDSIVSPANIVLMGVPRRIATDYIIWNRDSQSKILWQARERLENSSGFRFEDFLKVKQVLNEENPTYFVSQSFRYSGAGFVDSGYGLEIYKKNDSEEIAVTGFFVDFGTGHTRQFLKKGWRGDEGPYPGGWPTFVWAIGSQAEIDVYVGSLASDKVLSFRGKSFVHDQSINIIVNASVIFTIDVQPGWHEYNIPVPASYLKIGKNVLRFDFRYPKNPAEFGEGTGRRLAVAFDWLSLEDEHSRKDVSPIIYVESAGPCGDKTPCYASLREAISEVGGLATIRMGQGAYNEDIILDEPKELFLEGGWDCSFTSRLSTSTINSMTIRGGTVTTERLVIQLLTHAKPQSRKAADKNYD